MPARSRVTGPSRLVALLLFGLATACSSSSDSSAPAVDPLVATWNATSFNVNGVDQINAGMHVTLTLTNANTYTLHFENDLITACSNTLGETCDQTGSYSTSGSSLTIDPGTSDSATFTYAISGNTMTWSGSINSTPVTVTFSKA